MNHHQQINIDFSLKLSGLADRLKQTSVCSGRTFNERKEETDSETNIELAFSFQSFL